MVRWLTMDQSARPEGPGGQGPGPGDDTKEKRGGRIMNLKHLMKGSQGETGCFTVTTTLLGNGCARPPTYYEFMRRQGYQE